MKGVRLLVLASALLTLPAISSAAAPLAGPCAPGTAYDPACDVNHDNQITITDIQLTAGHWNQAGTWVSDNQHDHLGQTWTGTEPLRLTGAFSAPDYAPLVLSNTTDNGLRVVSAGYTGVSVGSADYGVVVDAADYSGLLVDAAGHEGVYVDAAGRDGVKVYSAGDPSDVFDSPSNNGFEVVGAEGMGLYVGRADEDGVRIRSATDDGVQIGEDGSFPHYGLYVAEPGTPGYALWPNTANPSGQWALYTLDNIEAGNVLMNAQTLMAVVGGDEALSPGDVVAANGLADPIPGSLNRLAQVRLATADQANVVGVVSSHMALQPAPGKEDQQVMQRTDGPAQPGDYVAITVLGAAQVKVQEGADIQPGQRLTAGKGGTVRALLMRTVEGMAVTEGAPVIGVALETPKDGMVWVLVNPQ